MHVGILASNLSPNVGGGFTFEEETLSALSRLAPSSAHTFTIFAQPNSSAPHLENSHVHAEPLPDHRQWSERIKFGWSQLSRLSSRSGRREWRRGGRPTWLGEYLSGRQIDFMWYPPPAVADVPTAEIPYLTVVWDLQHRLQPYFPEVSAAMEWELRERRYTQSLRRATYIITGTRAGQSEIERFYQIAPERIRILPHPTPRFALEAGPRISTTDYTDYTDRDQNSIRDIRDIRGSPESCGAAKSGFFDESATGKLLQRFDLAADFIFYPAQLWPHKNHTGLLQALRILKDTRGLTPLLALSGSDKGNQAHLCSLANELGIASQVRWLGFVERPELIALYRHARLMAYPSFFGPENLPPLEAFAFGCPVVAARVSGAEEQLADAAVLFDPARPEELAEAVFKVWSNAELRQSLIGRGLERAARFTGDDFVWGVLKLLDEFAAVRSCWPRTAA